MLSLFQVIDYAILLHFRVEVLAFANLLAFASSGQDNRLVVLGKLSKHRPKYKKRQQALFIDLNSELFCFRLSVG